MRSRLLGSSTFRLALLYLGLFASSVLILLAFIYWSTIAFMSDQVDTTVNTEIVGLSEQYRERGLNGLIRTIEDRIDRNPTSSSIYLFTSAAGRRLAGNLSGWPAAPADPDGWLDFEVTADADASTSLRARARVFTLTGGFRLLVGRDIRELQASQALIEQALWWGLAITVGLGLAGGFMLSRGVLSRIEQINLASRDIMSGDLSRRVPAGGSSDFDELATNLNAMLDEIERLMAGIKQVSDNIAHDLRTPLTRLHTHLDSLRTMEEAMAHPDARSRLESCIADADQLLSTFNALLRISRIESGGHELELTTLNPAMLLADAAELYGALAEAESLTLDVEAPDVRLTGDRDLIFQAVCNLLDNAIKFAPADSRVTLQVSDNADQVTIAIRDAGAGVAPAEYEKITQRFYRSEQSRSSVGSGLGLSLVAAIVRAHHGKLRFQQASDGFTVSMELPKVAPVADAAQR
jgi:signal transduction histidine kinase